MKCPKCGKEVRAGAKFCGYCGAPLVSPPAPVQKKKAFPVFLCIGFAVLCMIALVFLFSVLQKRNTARLAVQQELMAFADVLPSVSTSDPM